MHCFREVGWVELVARSGGGIADLGYEGAPHLRIPVKKRAGVDLADAERALNTRFAKIRVAVEWGVARAKNWRIMTTRYRSDLRRIDTDIQAVAGLQKLNETHAERRLSFCHIKWIIRNSI